MTSHTFAEGDVVRVAGWRGVGRIVKFRLTAGEVDVWFGLPGRGAMRTVSSDRLLPAKRGDMPPVSVGVRR